MIKIYARCLRIDCDSEPEQTLVLDYQRCTKGCKLEA